MAKSAKQIVAIIEEERKTRYNQRVAGEIHLLEDLSERMFQQRVTKLSFSSSYESWTLEARDWLDANGFSVEYISSIGWQIRIKD